MSAEKGYEDAGTPPPTNAAHKRRMEQGGLAKDEALAQYENMQQNTEGLPSKGFLKRNNFKDRF